MRGFFAKKQCITIFDYPVWPETLSGNRNQLAKANCKDIIEKINSKQIIDCEYQPFGDGHAAERILNIINERFGQ